MESSLKFTDNFEIYDGTPDTATGLQRTKVVTEMQDVELMVLYPVLLRNDVHAIYDGLGVEDKKDAIKIKDVLF